MRRRLLLNDIEGIHSSASKLGDFVFYNNSALKIIIVPLEEWTIELYPENKYTPIGIVLVPGTHNVYKNGSCGVSALVLADPNNPDTGSIRANINFGSIAYLSEYEYRDLIPYVKSQLTQITETIQGVTSLDEGCIVPIKSGGNIQNPYDTKTKYSGSYPTYYFVPSAYTNSGSLNSELIKTTNPSNNNNIFSYFNGKLNTEIFINHAIALKDWKTASKITNSYTTGYYPAACCCWRFHTIGTKLGDWYLPSTAEILYLSLRDMPYYTVAMNYPQTDVTDLYSPNYQLTSTITNTGCVSIGGNGTIGEWQNYRGSTVLPVLNLNI